MNFITAPIKGSFFPISIVPKAGHGVGANAFDQGDQFYLTKSKLAAEWFAAKSEQEPCAEKFGISLERLGEIPKLKGSVLVFDAEMAKN